MTCDMLTSPYAVEKVFARGSRCDDVDNRIPKALEWEDKRGGQIETETGVVGMGKGVYAVDARWDLSNLVSIHRLKFSACIRRNSPR